MFTGIVEAVGRVAACTPGADGVKLRFDARGLRADAIAAGDSIAVNGVCLTVTHLDGARFDADVSGATLAATTLGTLSDGAEVNLERALTPATPLGGHLVSGHVDGVAEVIALDPAGASRRLRVRVPGALTRYIARKGSICIDGVSLTVNAIDGDTFEANLVPHTLANTTLGMLTAGSRVNVEVDMVARYLERLLEARDI